MSLPVRWSDASAALTAALELRTSPIAITFSASAPAGVVPFDAPMTEPTPDGRSGRVAAGCVFWTKAVDRTFTTVAADHGNCSVGSLTHGFATLDEVAGRTDVAALLDSGWVTMEMIPGIPVVADRPDFVVYGPLSETPVDPDVVLSRTRTAMPSAEMTCAIPASRLEALIIRIQDTATTDAIVASYAAQDARRFVGA